MESLWYDKEGNVISDREAVNIRLADPDYKRVAMTHIGKEVDVSTVWFGLNSRWDDGPPLIFETLVFGGKHDQYMERYSTKSEAEEGHKRIVAMVMTERKWWKRWAITFGRKGR